MKEFTDAFTALPLAFNLFMYISFFKIIWKLKSCEQQSGQFITDWVNPPLTSKYNIIYNTQKVFIQKHTHTKSHKKVANAQVQKCPSWCNLMLKNVVYQISKNIYYFVANVVGVLFIAFNAIVPSFFLYCWFLPFSQFRLPFISCCWLLVICVFRILASSPTFWVFLFTPNPDHQCMVGFIAPSCPNEHYQ